MSLERVTSGSIPATFKNCNTVAEMRALAPLPKDAEELIDAAVVRVGLDRLVVFQDVVEAGLTFPLANPLSVMEVYWEKISKVGHAQRTMLPDARNERQIADRTGVRVPIYITMDDFSFNSRTLAAAARSGQPIDVSHVEQATRRVNEALEDAMINGAGLTVAGVATPGIINAPNVNTFVYEGSGMAWDDASKTGEEILQDTLTAIDDLQAAKRYGPYNLYVPTTYGNKLREDFKANSALTIHQRLEQIEAGGRNLIVRTADQLPTDKVALIQMTSDVIDVITGSVPTVVTWEDGPGFNTMFAVMAIMVPRTKDDADGSSGITVGFTS